MEADLQLPQHGLAADAERSLLGGLANGEEHAQASSERRQHLPVELDVGLMEVATSLGMSEQHQIDIERKQHANRDLAGVGALGSPVDVLRTDPDPMRRLASDLGDRAERRERRNDKEMDLADLELTRQSCR